MTSVKNLSIWKAEEKQKNTDDSFLNTEIAELGLGVRSYNCLKRANCHTVGDIIHCMGEDGLGLRKIRNLGNRSEAEIIERIQQYKEQCALHTPAPQKKKVTIIKPAKKVWDSEIEEFHLSNFALTKLKACGINRVKDLYATDPKKEPGWYAVRELFEKIPSCR